MSRNLLFPAVLCVIALFVPTIITAKSKPSKGPSERLPEELIYARTVFLARGEGSDKALKGGAELAFETFYGEMTAWKRFKIVDSPGDADVVFEFAYESQQVGTRIKNSKNISQMQSNPRMAPFVTLTVYDRKTGLFIWSASEARELARMKRDREDNLVKAVQNLVAELRKRVEETPR